MWFAPAGLIRIGGLGGNEAGFGVKRNHVQLLCINLSGQTVSRAGVAWRVLASSELI